MNDGAMGGLNVRPLPGTGVLVRLGDLVLACATTGAQELVRIATEVHTAGGDGRELSRRLMRWALDHENAGPACAMMGPAGGGRIALLAYGPASIVGTVDGTAFAVTGADSEHPVTRLVGGAIGLVQVRLSGSAVADPLLRLDGGVVNAGGAEVTGFGPASEMDRVAAGGYRTEPMEPPGADDIDDGGWPVAPLLPPPGGATGTRRPLPNDELPRRVPLPVPGGEPVRYGGLSVDRAPEAPAGGAGELVLPVTERMDPPRSLTSTGMEPPLVVIEDLQPGAGSPAVGQPPVGGPPAAGQPAEGQPTGRSQPAIGQVSVAAPPVGPSKPAVGQASIGIPRQDVVAQPAGPSVVAQPAGGGPQRPGGVQPPARAGGLAAVLRERTRHQQPVVGAPQPNSSALRFPDRDAAYQAVLLVEGSVTENSLPPVPAQPAVMVDGVACVRDHLNPPGTQWCHVCSADIPPAAQQRVGPRPALGILVLDNAMSFVLDADYVAGREPQIDRDVAAGQARPLLVTDPEGIVSRRHIRVHLDGWRVSLIDLGSANGTQVHRPGRPHPETVARGSSVLIEPGTEISLGPRRLRFEAHSLVNIGT